MKKKLKFPGKTDPKSGRTPLTVPLRDRILGFELIQVERAAGDVRAGVPVLVTDSEGSAIVLAAETAERERIEESVALSKGAQTYLLLTPERAAALKIRQYTKDVLAVPVGNSANEIISACQLADPSRDLDNPMRGPFHARRENLPRVAKAVLQLMKHASLLPSALMWLVGPKTQSLLSKSKGLLSVSSTAAANYGNRSVSELRLVTQAALPLHGAKSTRILAFRPPSGAREHLALLIGEPSPVKPPLVRIHSECLTGDLLGSLKCDCGDQLRGAIERMGLEASGGVLLYLAQEGRGIGLINKLRAYDLQDQGFDTIDANTRLGFEADERRFGIASEILKRLGFVSIRLLTNNPQKVAAMQTQGIRVTKRIPHAFPANPHNAAYLNVKARKAGHIL